MENEPILICPNCKESFIMEKINCGIFRHAFLISNFQQINPHASKEICDQLISSNSIYGCGKPFKIVQDTSEQWIAVECEYI